MCSLYTHIFSSPPVCSSFLVDLVDVVSSCSRASFCLRILFTFPLPMVNIILIVVSKDQASLDSRLILDRNWWQITLLKFSI